MLDQPVSRVKLRKLPLDDLTVRKLEVFGHCQEAIKLKTVIAANESMQNLGFLRLGMV